MVRTERVYLTPPAAWLEDCATPELAGTKNRDLLAAYEARGLALAECNVDKMKLREWRNDATSNRSSPTP